MGEGRKRSPRSSVIELVTPDEILTTGGGLKNKVFICKEFAQDEAKKRVTGKNSQWRGSGLFSGLKETQKNTT